jgi:CRP-like cAMP-binding protein
VALGAFRSPFSYVVSWAGDGLAMDAAALARLIAERDELRRMLSLYAHVAVMQAAEGALASGSAQIDQRVARWMLMRLDRLECDMLPVTHDHIAALLGMRRASVTDALHRLEGRYLIRSHRGQLILRDRPGLEAAAGATYGPAVTEMQRLFSWCGSGA